MGAPDRVNSLYFVQLVSLVCVVACGVARVAADEVIQQFHSELTVHADSAVTVTETITVQAEGHKIRRGIYRDFRSHVTLLEVLRDGVPEDYHVEPRFAYARLYIGKRDEELAPGIYTYILTYEARDAVRFFDNHDEVYWNVTGTQWDFPILEALAAIVLPETVSPQSMTVEGYTGPLRSKGQDYVGKIAEPGLAHVTTTRSLNAGEGLTIVVTFPKGVVDQPSVWERSVDMLLRSQGDTIMLGGFLVLLVYFLVAWTLVGRDPPPGQIVPTAHPPQRISPAGLRYVMKGYCDDTTVTAALISSAVKGYLRIEQSGDLGEYVLVRDSGNLDDLTVEEQALAGSLLNGRKLLPLTRGFGAIIHDAVTKFEKKIKGEYGSEYIHTNLPYFLPGLGMTFGVALVALYRGDFHAPGMAFFLSLWLSLWTAGVAALLFNTAEQWLNMMRSFGFRQLKTTVFWTLLSVPFVMGEVFGIVVLARAASPGYVAGLVGAMALLPAFYVLLQAPTAKGRALMDQAEGFAQYLRGQGGNRFDGLPADERTRCFEQYLPYAIALDEETVWSTEFDRVLGVVSSGNQAQYHPVWYPGTAAQPLTAAGLVGSIGSSFGAAVSSSSGSGGGGSSGGGGGGGGGGGW